MIKPIGLVLLGVLAGVGWAGAADRTTQWKQVDEALEKGLPKTALEALEPIIAGALQDQAYGEAAKAIARKVTLEGAIEGSKPEERMVRLEAELDQAPAAVRPVLTALLGHGYWQYFQKNRWRFMQRTATAQPTGDDFTTWDLPRLFEKIHQVFQLALADPELLKQTPVSTLDDFLEKGTMPDRYRPTLYDFIAQEALDFYTAGEQRVAQPQDAFQLSADSPIFDPIEAFLAWKPESTDSRSPILRAIKLYQDLLRFHGSDKDLSAFLDIDLARLTYGNKTVYGENRADRFGAALQQFIQANADHELAASALHTQAQIIQGQGKLVEARRLALRGWETHPDSVGGRRCQNLVRDIEEPSSQLQTERVWTEPWPNIRIAYRNITNLHFRAVAWDWEAFLDRNSNRPENLNNKERAALLAKKPFLEWSVTLPPTLDYQGRIEEVPAPKDLPKGFYFLVASHRPDFNDADNPLTYTDVWVSDLALVLRTRNGNLEGFVLQANQGDPLPEARVDAWYLDRNGRRVAVPPSRTDQDGFFTFKAVDERNRGFLVRVRHGQDELGSQHNLRTYQRPPADPSSRTLFFTDRALYRPGQTIHYKGICLRVDSEGNNYRLLPGQSVKVVFADSNGKEIARQTRPANDYGSISGSFTAPRDRLMGRMRIFAEGGRQGDVWINVEEYKRPKFQVTLEIPKTAAKLEGPVQVSGAAESYTGVAVDGATVQYRVVREVRMPPWWGWFSWRQPQPGSSQEIAHGTTQTDKNGRFEIEFTARPDRSVAPTNEPVFHFTIHADVTDPSGETRSDDQVVRVGYTALQAALSADDWQTASRPVIVQIKTSTLDDEPQAAKGKLAIHRLQAPERVRRAPFPEDPLRWSQPQDDPSDPNQWPLGEVVAERAWTSTGEGQTELSFALPAGCYRAMLETQDRFGKTVTAQLPLRILEPEAAQLALPVPNLVAAPTWRLEPGQNLEALWGTGYHTGRALVEIEHRHRILKRFWTEPGRTQQQIRQEVTEEMRGGFTLHVTQVRENRVYLISRHVEVPWSNKELELKWEHFVSKLEPAQKETWTAVITRKKSGVDAEGAPLEGVVAEMVAALYDESLDQFTPHEWLRRFDFFHRDSSSLQSFFENSAKPFDLLQGRWEREWLEATLTYRHFPYEIVDQWMWNRPVPIVRALGLPAAKTDHETLLALTGVPPEPASLALADSMASAVSGLGGAAEAGPLTQSAPGQPAPAGPDLGRVSARENLSETAFFLPHLISDSNGIVRIQFTMPEALTRWRFLGFAHDQDLRSGYLEDHAVTAKDLMIQPNPPRFLREGDELEFTVKVINPSPTRQTGQVRLTFHYARNERPADADLSNHSPELTFDIPAHESRSFSWRLSVPDGCDYLSYKAVGATARLSDGEAGYLPVLSRKVFLTESLPLPLRGPATKTFRFEKLLQSGQSDTLEHHALTVQMVSNPAWYAVLALPYLMEFPHQCTEQTFNRLYANSLAQYIALADPKIRRIFDQWKNTPALESPLEKNQDLKSVMIEETPWYRQARSESEARRNVGVLFDGNRLQSETETALRKLSEAQLEDGSWPWFPGGAGNDYITLYITTGFGRLRHLGVDVNVDPALRSLQRLDRWMDEHYQRILQTKTPKEYVPSATDALYLYGRSFFLKNQPIPAPRRAAVDFFLDRAREHWLKVAHRQAQGHLALALHRFGDRRVPADIMRSIKEFAVTNEEMGMFWRDTELSWWWYRAPIETQALMIEAFDEIMNDAQAVEECRVWLLKQKQTRDWKTTKATADAVYALLLRGRDLLTSDALVEVALAGQVVRPESPRPRPGEQPQPAVEAGTGFYEKRWEGATIKPEMGHVTVVKSDPGVAWGGLHWQYFEDIAKVTSHTATPLQLKKTLHTRTHTKEGQILTPVTGPLAVGAELVVRIELRVDRDLEYVHLKDHRGSGTEPVDVISSHRFQDGLRYYASTRDTASHFFIDYLPKGVYVFEYATRIQHRGRYQSGLAEIQCMYAPEFNSHSQSLPLVVE